MFKNNNSYFKICLYFVYGTVHQCFILNVNDYFKSKTTKSNDFLKVILLARLGSMDCLIGHVRLYVSYQTVLVAK